MATLSSSSRPSRRDKTMIVNYVSYVEAIVVRYARCTVKGPQMIVARLVVLGNAPSRPARQKTSIRERRCERAHEEGNRNRRRDRVPPEARLRGAKRWERSVSANIKSSRHRVQASFALQHSAPKYEATRSATTMYKFVALLALLACAAAAPEPGYLAAPAALHAAPVVAAAPAVAVAHTVPVATSYANTYKVSVKSPLVAAPVVAAAPVLKAAPVVAAAPVFAHAAPFAYAAHAPVVALH